MLKVVGLYRKDGVLHGFKIEDEGPYSITPMMLYLEQNIKDLIEAGYTFYDYDPTHIKLPSGESIMSLPELPLDVNIETEIRFSRSGLTQLLSDAQASRYYSNSNTTLSSIDFVKYPGPFLINTREELMAYVDKMELAMLRNPAKVEVRPFNTLVNPDIWFTPVEIFTEHSTLYRRICGLRKWGSYEHLLRTVQFFIDQGLMTADDINMRSILRAWYAYGPDLIKGQYTESHISLNVDGSFFSHDALNSIAIETKDGKQEISICGVNRRASFGAYNTRTGKLVSWTGEEVDADSLLSLSRGTRYPIYMADANFNRLKMSSVDSEVIPTRLTVADATDRFYCSIAYDGCTYKFKADPYRLQLNYSSYDNLCFDVPFLIATLNTSSVLPLAEVDNYDKYRKLLTAQLYTLHYTKNNTVEPESKSNSTYLNQLHLTPTGVVKKYANRKSTESVVGDLARHWADYKGVSEALALYTQPIPDNVLTALGVTEQVTKEEFLRVADIDSYAQWLSEANEDNNVTPPPTFIADKSTKQEAAANILKMENNGYIDEPYNYYYKIKLVQDALSGLADYGCLEEGKRMDSEIVSLDGAMVLYATINALIGTNCTYEEFCETLAHLENRVDFRLLYRKREAAAVGYIRDFATDAEASCSRNTFYWCYVTKVFRELSNRPVMEQRPYLLEMLVFSKVNKVDNYIREAFMTIAENALEDKVIVPDLNYDYPFETEGNTITDAVKLSKKFAGYFASRLMFNCIIGVKSGRIPKGQDYVETGCLFGDIEVTFTVPTAIVDVLNTVDIEAHRKYAPVHFYCTYDIAEGAELGASQFACVNAEITPWSVKALPGYQIKSYPFMYNYYDAGTLIQSFGEERVNALVSMKSKIADSIMAKTKPEYRTVKEMNALGKMVPVEKLCAPEASLQGDLTLSDEIAKHAATGTDFDVILQDAYINESVAAYVKRWTVEKQNAANQGKTLLSIPLKQDVLYKEIGNSLGFEVYDETVLTDDSSMRANFLAEDVIVLPNTTGSQFITQKGTRHLEPVNTLNVEEAIANNFHLILNSPMLQAVCLYGVIMHEGGVATDSWIKENFVQITDKKYIGKLQNGYFIYEEE